MDVKRVRERLLAWYDVSARELPWRTSPSDRARGALPDPYRVWLSEVMLQQTTAPHAAAYFDTFTRRWPQVEALARAPEDEVMAAWAGLGYYARARNLIACARAVADRGGFPDTEDGLRALPGIGPYTAAAVAAIAFERPAVPVDGNVERVVSRLWAVETPLPAAKPELRALAARLASPARPGDFAQAMMDLGAVVCRPRGPRCDVCPLADECAAFATGSPQDYPRKTAKAPRPRRFGTVFVLRRAGEVALVRRPPRGLLGGMLGLPTTDWLGEHGEATAPETASWRPAGEVEHVFTHFALSLRILTAEADAKSNRFVWTGEDEALSSLPSVFAKALSLALQRPFSRR